MLNVSENVIINFSQIDPITKATNGWLGEINGWTILIRILFVIACASLLGIERSQKRHTAGLRTFILVSLAAVVAGIVDIALITYCNMVFPALSLASVVGIAIISANTMLFSSKNQIKGLTTAVGLWASTFIGILFGIGLYLVAIILFVAFFISLYYLPILEIYLKNRSNHFDVHLELKNKTDLVNFTTTARKLGLKIDDIEANPAYINSGLSVFTISFTIVSKELKKYKTHKEIIEALSSLDYINCIEEM